MTHQRTRSNTYDTQTILVYSGFACICGLFALYVYFVSASVLHVVMRQEVERRTSTLYTEIAQLEAEYIQAQHSVSEDIASLQGYVEADTKIFIDRSSVAAVALSRSEEE